ncbi:MAG: bifunctional ornithine acetyltransferase/N-acetylglutamate synthase, partial [Actinomycetota bacterium]|nr:bifunctional ornithine acetyltransferase/N-acetylglutamate synthase [Actinomycetota bacterium]
MESDEFEKILGGVCAPEGFLACGISCGIKQSQGLDLALVYSEPPAFAAGVFTTNKFSAAPVIYSKECLANGRARAVVINSGNANAGTGKQGLDDARKMAQAVEDAIGIGGGEVLVGSTGVIGEFMPMDKVIGGIDKAVSELSSGGNTDAAKAIMTTDTRVKEIALEMEIDGRVARMGAMAKGAGMIHPNLATMLAVITTDLPLAPDLMAD